MESPYLSWCREHAQLTSKQFLDSFYNDFQPDSQTLAEFANWMFNNMPQNNSFFDIQDKIWSRLEGFKWNTVDITQVAAYKAFKARQKSNEKKTQEMIQNAISEKKLVRLDLIDPEAYKEVAPLDLQELWKKHFPKHTIEQICQLIIGDVPYDDGLEFEDVILQLFYSLLFNISNDSVIEYVAKLIVGIRLSHDQLICNDVGQKSQTDNLSESSRKVVTQFSLKLLMISANIDFKGTKEQVLLRKGVLQGLCYLTQFLFSNVHYIKKLSQPMSTLYSEKTTKKIKSFSPILSAQYIQSMINASVFIRKKLNKGPLNKALDQFEKDLQFLLAAIRNIKKEDHLPSLLMKWHAKTGTIARTLRKNLDSISEDNSIKNDWLFEDSPSYNNAAVSALVFNPLLPYNFHLKSSLSHSVKLDKKTRLLWLPETESLVTNLLLLYEKRVVIAGYLDQFRMKTNPLMQVVNSAVEKKGHSMHETISDFSINLKRIELSNLITLLKPTRDIENVGSGEILCGINSLKLALPDYLDDLIMKAIDDSQELMESIEKFFEIHQLIMDDAIVIPAIQYMKDQIIICSKNSRQFLEGVAWLQTYFQKQRSFWNEELCKPPVKQEKKKGGQKSNKNKPSKTEKGPPPKPDEPLPVPPAPVKIIAPPIVPVEKGPTPSELWKAEVAKVRIMRKTAKRLKRIEEARLKEQLPAQKDLAALNKLLEGSLRRRSPQEVAFLSGKKVREIIAELENEGWEEYDIKGSHHIYKHPCLRGNVVIPYSSQADQIDRGTFQSIAKTAGWVD